MILVVSFKCILFLGHYWRVTVIFLEFIEVLIHVFFKFCECFDKVSYFFLNDLSRDSTMVLSLEKISIEWIGLKKTWWFGHCCMLRRGKKIDLDLRTGQSVWPELGLVDAYLNLSQGKMNVKPWMSLELDKWRGFEDWESGTNLDLQMVGELGKKGKLREWLT